MKIQGHSFEAPNQEICVIPRGNGKDVAFICNAVLDYDEFDLVCKMPSPPKVIKPGEGLVENRQDPKFLENIGKYAERKMNWMILKSLQGTPDLTWEKVNMTDPKTWHLYKEELKEAFFNTNEITRIQNAVFAANSLNEFRVNEARENFLRGRQVSEADTSGLQTTPDSSASGEPANDSESDLQK